MHDMPDLRAHGRPPLSGPPSAAMPELRIKPKFERVPPIVWSRLMPLIGWMITGIIIRSWWTGH